MSSSSLTHLSAVQTSASRSIHWRAYFASLACIDTLMIGCAFVIADRLRYYANITLKPEVIPDPSVYVQLLMLTIPAWIGLFAVMRLYDRRVLLGGTEEYMLAFNACTTGVIFVLMLSFFLEEKIVISRAWLIMSWALAIILVCAGRLVMRRIAYRLRGKGYFIVPAIVIGTNTEAKRIVEQLSNSRYSGLSIQGIIAPGKRKADAEGRPRVGVPVMGTIRELPDLVARNDIKEIIVATTALRHTDLLDIFDLVAPMRNVELRLSSGLYEVLTTDMKVRTIGSVPLMSISRVRLDRFEMTLKGALDFGISLLMLVLLLPLLVALSVAIKLDSPGPVIHRRRVLGMGGEAFDAFKFRTMVVNGDEILDQTPDIKAQLKANHKLQEDPRVTRVGRWLRKTSIDELPQLFNVLLGQMSLVGPRMITSNETSEYGQMRHNLLTVKPGITGLWQVSGRSDLSYDERVQLDMYYIRNYTIWLDLQILFVQTLPAVINRRGAY